MKKQRYYHRPALREPINNIWDHVLVFANVFRSALLVLLGRFNRDITQVLCGFRCFGVELITDGTRIATAPEGVRNGEMLPKQGFG